MGKKIASGPNSKAARAQSAAAGSSSGATAAAGASRKQLHNQPGHHQHNQQPHHSTHTPQASSSIHLNATTTVDATDSSAAVHFGEPSTSGAAASTVAPSDAGGATKNPPLGAVAAAAAAATATTTTTGNQQQQQQSNAPNNQLVIAHIRVHDNFKLLPRYSAALSRPHDDSMPPEDLDAIQKELETLLSTVARRAAALRHEALQLERGHHLSADASAQPAAGASGAAAGGSGRRDTKKTKDPQPTEKPSGKRKRGATAAADHSAAADAKKKDKYYGGQRKLAKSKGANSPANVQALSSAASTSSASSTGAAAGGGNGGTSALHAHGHLQHSQHGAGIADASAADALDGRDGSVHGSADHPKVLSMPMKNDVPNKFWLSVEPYCMPISHEDIKLLDDLIAEYSGPLVPAIPDLGPHYSRTWAQEDLRDEQDASNANAKANRRFTSAVGGAGGTAAAAAAGQAGAAGATGAEDGAGSAGGEASQVLEMLRKGEKLMGEQVTGPLTQRLMAAFVEENIIPPAVLAPNIEPSASADDLPVAQPAAAAAAAAPQPQIAVGAPVPLMARNGISLERRVRQELIEQGLLCAEDFAKDRSGCGGGAADGTEDDEILNEIVRVRTELATIAEYNFTELQKLRQLATVEMRRLDVKRKLDIVDQEIVDMYKRVALIKQSKQQKRRRLTDAERTEVLRLTEEQKRLSDQLEAFNR